MVDLSRRELEAGLWCIHVVAQGYGDGGPDHDVITSLQSKLLEEAQPAPRKAPDIPGYEVNVQGKGWQ